MKEKIIRLIQNIDDEKALRMIYRFALQFIK